MKKRLTCVLVAFIMVFGAAMSALAHSGRTDSSGGHRDNKNKSGLGSYHYHCGGYPPHLHTDGCPYKGGGGGSGGGAKPTATAKPAAKPTASPKPAKIIDIPETYETPEGEMPLRYGLTNAKNVNIRAEASTRATRVAQTDGKGSPLLIVDQVEGADGELWFEVLLDYGTQKERLAYIKAEFVNEVERDELLKSI